MPGDLSIRPYIDEDFNAVLALWQACDMTRPWNDPAKDINFCQNAPASCLFVGIKDDTVIATAMLGHDGHRGVLYYLAVHPDQQGKDYGRQMVRHGEDWLKGLGVWKLNLMIRDDNEPVRDFYQAIGYEEEPRIVMTRRLEKEEQ
jgi:ribosomal protein S18 acetylase RimI-like enzyme